MLLLLVPVSLVSMPCTGSGVWGLPSRCLRQVLTSVVPGTGTGIPGRDVTSPPWNIHLVFPLNSNRIGTGPKFSLRNRTSWRTPITWLQGLICVVIYNSTRGSNQSPIWTTRISGSWRQTRVNCFLPGSVLWRQAACLYPINPQFRVKTLSRARSCIPAGGLIMRWICRARASRSSVQAHRVSRRYRNLPGRLGN